MDVPCALSNHDPLSMSLESVPATPVVIGEACLVDFRPLNSKFSTRRGMKPVDCLYANTIRSQDISICNVPCPNVAQHTSTSHVGLVLHARKSRRIPRASLTPSRSDPRSSWAPRRTSRRRSLYNNHPTHMRSDYVHQGTNTEKTYTDRGSNTGDTEASAEFGDGYTSTRDRSFQPILPIVEDVVIHFKGEQPDLVLEHIIQGLKEASPPLSTPVLVQEAKNLVGSDRPRSLASRQSTPCQDPRQHVDIEEPGGGSPLLLHTDEYDPFASHGEYPQACHVWPDKQNTQVPTLPISAIPPPTPVHTPPSRHTASRQSRQFHVLRIDNRRTVIEIQDSLRSVFRTCFPSEEFSFISELGEDWQPVFRSREPSASGGREPGVDLILAIGAQEGVDRGFFATLRGSLERLGTKPNGVTRSGRLDLRYVPPRPRTSGYCGGRH